MKEHLLKNWPVYVGIVGFIWFVTVAIISSRKQEKKDQEQKKPQDYK